MEAGQTLTEEMCFLAQDALIVFLSILEGGQRAQFVHLLTWTSLSVVVRDGKRIHYLKMPKEKVSDFNDVCTV